MIGTSLGRYRVLEPLGEGGMGRVYLAEDPVLGRKVAVKVLPPEFARDAERRTRLLHEARAASALNHPNILTVHDLGESEGEIYVAMEVVEGVTLRTWSQAASRTPAEVLRLMRQATAALGAAHAAGLVHRDLKPENIMVRGDGLLKILDFGLARSVSPGAAGHTATLPGAILGTAPYMSPEQVLGQPAGPASDLFSLGTILYELLTGRHPFAAATAIETMHRILHETPEPVSRVNRALSTDFDFVLAKALSKDPTRRHGSVHDLDVDLETLECGCGSAAAAPAAGAGGPRALAVLPFKNIGGDPELGYLGVGLADAVITRLSFSPDLIVRATSSIAPYQNQPIDPRRVGAELDVSAVLDASFQRAGERFRATARLVETPSGRALWAGKVDVRFEDIFEVQDQVAQGIAEAMTARLTERRKPAARFTPSAEAYALVMRGMEAAQSATREGFLRAISLFESAIALEPEYADAWAQLGYISHGMVDGSFDSDPAWRRRADEALARALVLDPEHATARFLAAVVALTRGEKREAYRGFVDALERRPHEAIVYHYFAYLFRLCDMLDEAMAADRRGSEIDPSVPWTEWGILRLHLIRGELEAAREQMDKARARFGDHPRFATYRLTLLVHEGRFQEAIQLAESILTADPNPRFEYVLALIRTGEGDRARDVLDRAEPAVPIDMDEAALRGALRAQLGDPDAAFRDLERAVALGNDMLTLYEGDLFAPLHGDPRWAPFLEGVRARVAQWKREFHWPPR